MAAISVLAVFSCTKHEDVLDKEINVVVSAGVMTRAGYSGTEILPENFVMDIVQNVDSKYDYKSILMVKDGDKNTFSPEPYSKMVWAVNSFGGVEVKAMTLPYEMESVDPDNSMTINVSAYQSTEVEILKSDLLAAATQKSGITITDGTIKIDFAHQLSKIDVKYILSDGLTPSDVTIYSATLENVCVQGGYSYAEMAFDEDIEQAIGSISMYHNLTDNTFEAIFLPFIPSVNPRLVVKAKVCDQERVLTCPVTAKDANGFMSGKRYMLNVSFKRNSIAVNSVDIAEGWDTETDDNTFDTI